MSSTTTTLQLSGMTCGACKKIVEKKLGKISGVNNVAVYLAEGNVEITADKSISQEEVLQALNGTHYQLTHLK